MKQRQHGTLFFDLIKSQKQFTFKREKHTHWIYCAKCWIACLLPNIQSIKLTFQSRNLSSNHYHWASKSNQFKSHLTVERTISNLHFFSTHCCIRRWVRMKWMWMLTKMNSNWKKNCAPFGIEYASGNVNPAPKILGRLCVSTLFKSS